ncbi:hypothetical protein OH77DRAFT_1594429 [Trametes cingulata]|nr:hypothetical protein OH77DRAFT_1594429 [Trametes cingulata]
MHLNPAPAPTTSVTSSLKLPSPAALPPSSSMTTKYKGPWIVQLGGDTAQRGIHTKRRPPQTALGHYKPLLPVVVTCANEEDAKALNRLNKTVFNIVSTEDNHSLIYKCANSPVTDLRIVGSPVYAFRVAVETGVWIGPNIF